MLTGAIHTWELFGKTRTFGETTLPYGQASKVLRAVRYNALAGKGQQREISEPHCRKLVAAMEEGVFTPTPVSANLTKSHREHLKIDNGTFRLEVTEDNPLLQTDGGHRFEALYRITKDLEKRLKEASGEAEKAKLSKWLDQANNAPCTITIYIDGDAQCDFVRLQACRPVDASHMFSLKIQNKLVEPPFRLAFETAKLLHKTEGSPFVGSIRFDSRGAAPLPISTLCSKGASDLGTSLVGLAKVGLSGEKAKDATSLAHSVISAFKALAKHSEELLETGKVLAPLSNDGTKGSSTMLLGVGVMLAYRQAALEHPLPTDDDISRLVDAADKTLAKNVNGNFSGAVKRELIGAFAKEFLADLATDPLNTHEGVPVELVRILSASTLNVTPLPKLRKQKATKSPKDKKTSSPKVPVVTPEFVAAAEVEAGNTVYASTSSQAVFDEQVEAMLSGERDPWDEPQPNGVVELQA
jgi:hypothetical protein